MGQRYSVKAGRFEWDFNEKKARVRKEKGELAIFTNSEAETHLSWVDLDNNIEQLDIMVFPFDAVFEKVAKQNNTYLLRFQSNDDKYFFYLQQKIAPEDFVKNVNDRIAYVPEQSQPMEIEAEVKPQKMEAEPVPKKVEIKAQPKAEKAPGLFNNDFIQRLQANLMAAKGGEGGITHLSKILTPEAINTLLSETSPEEKAKLLEFLPQQQKETNQLASNIRSPQFQQAVDVLSDALNSENAIPLFMELGLDQKHLRNHYGVHAFLKALEEWAQKQQQNK